jgi:uncharacterized protein YebE (UPF0316 family)
MSLLLLCFEIFFARILDVSIGVVRTIELIKNHTSKVVVLAFFEVFIWFLVAREAINTSEFSLIIAFFYSLGYAAGTFIGAYISNKYIDGIVGVQVVTNKGTDNTLNQIKKRGYGISSVTLDDPSKKMIFIEVSNKKLNDLIKLIKRLDDKAFIFVNETKYAYNGYIK